MMFENKRINVKASNSNKKTQIFMTIENVG